MVKVETSSRMVFKINDLAQKLNVHHLVWNHMLSTKSVMKIICLSLAKIDNTDSRKDVWNNKNNTERGNKLRLYRQYKRCIATEEYVKTTIPFQHRQVLAMFCYGSLPFCDNKVLKTEVRFFLLQCPLYTDIRFNLFNIVISFLPDIHTNNVENQFNVILFCDRTHSFISNSLYQCFMINFMVCNVS